MLNQYFIPKVKAIKDCKSCLDLKLTPFQKKAISVDIKESGFKYGYYPNSIKVLFIAESANGVNSFFYNKKAKDTSFRSELFSLINESRLQSIDSLDDFHKKKYYLIDAICCSWSKKQRDQEGDHTIQISKKVLKKCIKNLKLLIQMIDPKIIVTLGNTAYESVFKLGYKPIKLRFPGDVNRRYYNRNDEVKKLNDGFSGYLTDAGKIARL